MKRYLFVPVFATFSFVSSLLSAQSFFSGPTAPTVIELYTSEGCSSCPPADRFLSTLAKEKDPFLNVIPLAYHVDYWNYIGWDDRFAKAEYSQRQRNHVREGNTSQVYTPGFVVNNKEWRAWFRGNRFRGDRNIPTNSGSAGELSATLQNGLLDVVYSGHPDISGPYLLHIAYLGMGISTDVKAGENKNRTLHHDYVVLDNLSQISQSNRWQLKLDMPPEKGQQQTGLALWISSTKSQKILQADAALLEDDAF